MQTENSDQEKNMSTGIAVHGDVDPQRGRGMVAAVLQEHCGADEASAQQAADKIFQGVDQPAPAERDASVATSGRASLPAGHTGPQVGDV